MVHGFSNWLRSTGLVLSPVETSLLFTAVQYPLHGYSGTDFRSLTNSSLDLECAAPEKQSSGDLSPGEFAFSRGLLRPLLCT